jgi:hypothetical protein
MWRGILEMDTSKTIENFPNYVIYNDGRVYSLLKNKFLTPQNNGNGYMKVMLYNNSIKQVYIHRLVAQHFILNVNNYKYVDHIDRDKQNNHVYNLRWVSASENTRNTADKPRYSVERTLKYNSENTKSKIRELYKAGSKVFEISKLLNIPRQTVSNYIKDLRQSKNNT